MGLLSLAKELSAGIEAEATRAEVQVAITVFDREGVIVLQHRMAGAPVDAVPLSERKAYTAALVRRRTDELAAGAEGSAPDYAPTAVGGGRYCVLPGGVPLEAHGDVVGGVGVSGAGAEDAAIIDAGLGQSRARRTLREVPGQAPSDLGGPRWRYRA
jgi:uncharacterized protein GlcG (DUF336 family)